MCSFKYCQGAGACFLKDSSPCSDFACLPGDDQAQQFAEDVRVLGLSKKGFLNFSTLVEAAGTAEEIRGADAEPTVSSKSKLRRVSRIAA